MSKPDWCSEDIFYAAHNAIGFDSGCDCDHCCLTQGLVEPVARAILAATLAEREACARLVEIFPLKSATISEMEHAQRETALIAAAIRNRAQP